MSTLDFEAVRTKVLKLKQNSWKLSDRIAGAIPSGNIEPKPIETEGGDRHPENPERVCPVPEESFRESAEQNREQLEYYCTRVANLEREKNSLHLRISEMQQDNEALRGKLSGLERERYGLVKKTESLEKLLAEAEHRLSLEYILGVVEECIREFLRFSRDKIGVITECAQMCLSSKSMPGNLTDKIRLIEKEVKQLLNGLVESINKYHFEKVELSELDFNVFIGEVTNAVIKKYPQHGVVSSVQVHKQPVMILTDRKLFSEALEYIFLNSLESMPKGGHMEITYEVFRDNIVLFIADTGIGIPPHLMDKIYRPFFTTKTNHYGLGLNRVSWIFRILKYQIRMESSLHKGTKVTIDIPILARAGGSQ